MLYGDDPADISQAIDRGLAFIASQQLASGGFYSYSSSRPDDFDRAVRYRTTFFTSLILAALAVDDSPLCSSIRQQAASFLLGQASTDRTFNYWDRASRQATTMPYPDDLDDTCCALRALLRHDASLRTGEINAAIANFLIAAETAPGGPYRTWLVDQTAPTAWQDVDVVVNASIGGLLATRQVALPNVVKLIETGIRQHKLRSPYYPDDLAALYFITDWYRGPQQPQLIEWLDELADAPLEHPSLAVAMLGSSLLRTAPEDVRLPMLVKRILKDQSADGSWPARAFCIDPSRDGKIRFAGAASLTTALCVELLCRFSQRRTTSPPTKSHPLDSRYRQVRLELSRYITALPNIEARRACRAALRRVLRQDEDRQIILLPWIISQSIGATSDEASLRQLAVCSLWGWTAYTLYDDVWDADAGVELLPAAIICHRQMSQGLARLLPDNPAFQSEVRTVLDHVDAANAWELANCRGVAAGHQIRFPIVPDYGEYEKLADRSVGHMIAALGVLYDAGYATDSTAMKGLRAFFRHYLIARQLNDDLHDWEDDLRHGHCNAVLAIALPLGHGLQDRSATRDVIDVDRDIEALRVLIWQRVVPKVCHRIESELVRSRRGLRRFSVHDHDRLDELLDEQQVVVEETLRERQQAVEFIRTLSVKATAVPKRA